MIQCEYLYIVYRVRLPDGRRGRQKRNPLRRVFAFFGANEPKGIRKVSDNLGTFKKGEKRPGQGRPKGALNKTTIAAKEAIALAAEGLGGTDRLIAWAQEDTRNESAFWTTIYPKLLPLQVSGDVGVTVSWPLPKPRLE